MEVDDEMDARSAGLGINAFESLHATHSTHSTHSLPRRTPNSIAFQMAPNKLLNQTRRSSSGFLITSMFGARYRHMQKLHSEAFLGLNTVCLSALPVGAVFRSSLPATPVATPVYRESFTQFTEQAIRDRLCRTPSPRRAYLALALQHQQRHQQLQQTPQYSDPYSHETDFRNNDALDVQPMDVSFAASPMNDEPIDVHTKDDDLLNSNPNDGQQYYPESEAQPQTSGSYNERRLFVGNISYRVTEKELIRFFRKFGKVKSCSIVKDHIRKLPKGYGFVTFERENDAQSALNYDQNQLILDNRQLRVFRAKPKVCKQMKDEVLKLKNDRDQHIKLNENPISSQAFAFKFNTDKNNENCLSFDDLNDDIIIFIFKLIDNLIDRTKLELVCKRWHNLALNAWTLQERISFSETFYRFDAPVLTTNTLFSILKKCPNVKSINLKDVTKFIDTKALEMIAISCPLLEELIFDGAPVTDHGLKAFSEKCSNLKIIHMNECTSFSEKSFWWFLKNTSKLEALSVRYNSRITGKCFRLLSNNIKIIDISYCDKIRENGIKELVEANFLTLQELCVSSVNYEIMRLICSKLENLKKLTIVSIATLQNGVENGFKLISNLINLEILECFDKFEDLTDDEICKISKRCNKLRVINLTHTNALTDISITLISVMCENLKYLCITNSLITDQSLISLSQMKHLRHLDISGSKDISDTGLEVLISNCKSLCFLNIDNCAKATHYCIQFAVHLHDCAALQSDIVILYNTTRFRINNIKVDDIEEMIKEKEDYMFKEYSLDFENMNNDEYNDNDLTENHHHFSTEPLGFS